MACKENNPNIFEQKKQIKIANRLNRKTYKNRRTHAIIQFWTSYKTTSYCANINTEISFKTQAQLEGQNCIKSVDVDCFYLARYKIQFLKPCKYRTKFRVLGTSAVVKWLLYSQEIHTAVGHLTDQRGFIYI